MPNSRAMIAPCDSIPPRSTTSPEMSGNTGPQPGSVCRVTSTSPARSRVDSLTSARTAAGAVTTPPHAPTPSNADRASAAATFDGPAALKYSPCRSPNVSGGTTLATAACCSRRNSTRARAPSGNIALPATSASISSAVRRRCHPRARVADRRRGGCRSPGRFGEGGCKGGPA